MTTLLQLSDNHLFSDTAQRLCGVCPYETFKDVIAEVLVARHHFDAVLVTGDIAQEPCRETYVHFITQISRLNKPVYALPGNHDINTLLAQQGVFHQVHFAYQPMCWQISTTWRAFLLPTNVPTRVDGSVHSHLEWLEQQLILAEQQQQRVMLALHHNPLEVGSKWLDQHMLKDAEAFIRLIKKFTHTVKLIVHGHVHQQFESRIEHTQVLSVPSTCFQFLPKSDQYKIDPIGPGYRLIELHDHGIIKSSVHRLEKLPSGLDLSSTGY